MSTPIPKKSELRALAKAAIESNAFISDNSIPVVIRTGRNDKTVEKHLNRGVGTCVVIEPLQEAKLRDQSGRGVIVDCLLLIGVNQNPEQAANGDNGKNVDILDVMDGVTSALVRHDRHPGGEFFKVDTERAWVLSVEDEGLWRYAMFFTKESA